MCPDDDGEAAFRDQVKGAVLWRSGSQIVGQLVAWTSTFLVIRLLQPSDYGLVAMTGVVITLLNLLNGWGFASALVREDSIDRYRIGQVFGMLLAMNAVLAILQLIAAPFAADYFNHPMVADLLRVQALFFLANPFISLGNALLIRRMNFRRQSQINLFAAVVSAATALACGLAGWGVWTLVAAPMALWFTQGIGFAIAARLWIRPIFRWRGAGGMIRYGGAMILVQFAWFVQSQSDVFVGGRVLDAHHLGIYTTALLLTQIVAAKFVPALNEIAFASYSRIRDESGVMQAAFLKTVRLIMLVAMPFYVGLAVTAEPLVLTFLGPQWRESASLVPLLACAMPLMTLQILFAPATNALGRPGLAVRNGMIGAALMAGAFLVGARWGGAGLAAGWVAGMAALLLVTIRNSLPAIGVRLAHYLQAVIPAGGAILMGAVVAMIDRAGGAALEPHQRLALLVPAGAAAYAVILFLFARSTVREVIDLIRPNRLARA